MNCLKCKEQELNLIEYNYGEMQEMFVSLYCIKCKSYYDITYCKDYDLTKSEKEGIENNKKILITIEDLFI